MATSEPVAHPLEAAAGVAQASPDEMPSATGDAVCRATRSKNERAARNGNQADNPSGSAVHRGLLASMIVPKPSVRGRVLGRVAATSALLHAIAFCGFRYTGTMTVVPSESASVRARSNIARTR
jgi:hypothetical protein